MNSAPTTDLRRSPQPGRGEKTCMTCILLNSYRLTLGPACKGERDRTGIGTAISVGGNADGDRRREVKGANTGCLLIIVKRDHSWGRFDCWYNVGIRLMALSRIREGVPVCAA